MPPNEHADRLVETLLSLALSHNSRTVVHTGTCTYSEWLNKLASCTLL